MISLKNLHKWYGNHQVLKDVNLVIPPGKITAILGPNGSGKTTILKTILGLVIPDKGDLSFRGNPLDRAGNYRRNIGYLPQAAKFPENLRVRELLKMMEDIRGTKAQSGDLIELLDLDSYMDQKIKNLSGGTRQKVNTVLAFMFDSDLFVLDEPTAGLDPLALVKLKQLIYQKQNQGKTILLTTHIISLVEDMAHHIIFILEGRIYFEGPVAKLLKEQAQPDLEKAIANVLERESYANSKPRSTPLPMSAGQC